MFFHITRIKRALIQEEYRIMIYNDPVKRIICLGGGGAHNLKIPWLTFGNESYAEAIQSATLCVLCTL